MPTPEQIRDRLDELRRRGWQATQPFSRDNLIDAIIDHRVAVRELAATIPERRKAD